MSQMLVIAGQLPPLIRASASPSVKTTNHTTPCNRTGLKVLAGIFSMGELMDV